jgi:hypothetical protein
MTELSMDCLAELGDLRGRGTLSLDDDQLEFAGTFCLSLQLSEITAVRVHRGRLELVWPRGHAAFDLGRAAQDWAEALGTRRSLLDRLSVKPGAVVLVAGVDDFEFRRQLRERASAVLDWNQALATFAHPRGVRGGGRHGAPDAAGEAAPPTTPGADVIFLGLRQPADLQLLQRAEPLVARDGAVWAIHPRGDEQLGHAEVLAAGRAAGLLDVKVVRFSDSLTAHRFVVPPARR